MTLGAEQVKGGTHPRNQGQCVQAAEPLPPSIGGPYPIGLSLGGDFPGENGVGSQFKRTEQFKTIYVQFLDTKDVKGQRRYKLWIDYTSQFASDSKYYFKLRSEGKIIQTFWLSFQDVCNVTFDNDPQTFIDNVQMYEYK
jgi:hypothetical protein